MRDLFNPGDYPDLLIGLGDPDDAAVWKLDNERALVVTTDFFTPVVDDPYDYGMIAAANSLSDVYAMGGQPFLALNIAAMPVDLPEEILIEILRGGARMALQAGVVLAGGHTIQDKEPKYGLVVVGFVHPQRLLTKGGVRTGDVLALTKPLGFGVTTTALKQEKAAPRDVAEVVRWMECLNREAASLAVESGLHAATDITGFGLLGHAMEMAESSHVRLRFHMPAIPLVSGALKYARMGTFPGGAIDNFMHFGRRVDFSETITEEQQMLLCDPQTSGGLLIALPGNMKDSIMMNAKKIKQPIWFVGEAAGGEGIEVV